MLIFSSKRLNFDMCLLVVLQKVPEDGKRSVYKLNNTMCLNDLGETAIDFV